MKDIDTISILGTRFNSMVVVCDRLEGSDDARRLMNWYRIDHGLPDIDNAAWGYAGQGPHELSYSILREFFDREVAERDTDALCSNFISMLDQNKCFLVYGAQIRIILGIGPDGRIVRERIDGVEDPEMISAGAAISTMVETVSGGATEWKPQRMTFAEKIKDTLYRIRKSTRDWNDGDA